MDSVRPLGLYLHIPFCKQKCVYCDFFSLPRSQMPSMDTATSSTATPMRIKALRKTVLSNDVSPSECGHNTHFNQLIIGYLSAKSNPCFEGFADWDKKQHREKRCC